jgi:hypothetical protein
MIETKQPTRSALWLGGAQLDPHADDLSKCIARCNART